MVLDCRSLLSVRGPYPLVSGVLINPVNTSVAEGAVKDMMSRLLFETDSRVRNERGSIKDIASNGIYRTAMLRSDMPPTAAFIA
jgi:hypothetical protein